MGFANFRENRNVVRTNFCVGLFKHEAVGAVLVLTVLAISVLDAESAYIDINANSTGAYIEEDGTSYDDDHLGETAAYAMWSADTTLDPVTYGSELRTGNDVRLETFNLNSDGMIDHGNMRFQWDDPYYRWDQPNYEFSDQSTFESGYLYLTVFDSASPQLGDHYVSGASDGPGSYEEISLYDPDSGDPPPTPTLLDMTTASDDNLISTTTTIIPEPASLVLVILGLYIITFKRPRRRS